MKIVLATTAPGRGGVWTHILDLRAGLAAAGHEVSIATSPAAEALVADCTANGFARLDLDDSVRAAADVWHVHLHKTFDAAALTLQLRRRTLGRGALILTEHLPRVPASDRRMPWDPATPPARRKPGAAVAKTLVKRAQFAMADRVIAVSQDAKDFLVGRYSVPADHVAVVSNGVVAPAEPAPRPTAVSPRMEVVSLGALGWRKGYDVLIGAAHLAREDWRVTIFGEGPLSAQLRRQAEPVSDRVVFAGWVDDASSILARYDLFCLPTRGESCSYAALEAMAQGVPVLMSDVDGARDSLDGGLAGVLVPSDDAVALASALDGLAVAPAERVRMGRAAHEHVARNYSVQRMLELTFDVYRDARN